MGRRRVEVRVVPARACAQDLGKHFESRGQLDSLSVGVHADEAGLEVASVPACEARRTEMDFMHKPGSGSQGRSMRAGR